MRPTGLFALPDHLARLPKTGDPLEVLNQVVDFEQLRGSPERAPGYADGSRGGRPPYDPVVMFKILILATRHTVSDERMEFLIRDRLSWLRFLGFELGAPTPDRNTIWTFRERLTKAAQRDLDARWTANTGRQRPPDGGRRSRSRCSGTRTTSPSAGRSGSSGARPSPTQPATTARCCATWSRATTWRRAFGRTRRIARRPTRRGWRASGGVTERFVEVKPGPRG